MKKSKLRFCRGDLGLFVQKKFWSTSEAYYFKRALYWPVLLFCHSVANPEANWSWEHFWQILRNGILISCLKIFFETCEVAELEHFLSLGIQNESKVTSKIFENRFLRSKKSILNFISKNYSRMDCNLSNTLVSNIFAI